jgi:hypothetical protein
MFACSLLPTFFPRNHPLYRHHILAFKPPVLQLYSSDRTIPGASPLVSLSNHLTSIMSTSPDSGSGKADASRAHIPEFPRWMTIIRALQMCSAVTVMALTATAVQDIENLYSITITVRYILSR